MKNNLFNNLYDDSFDSLIKRLKQSILKNKKEYIITANSEIFSSDNIAVKNILSDKNNIIVCDGIFLTKIASKKIGKKLNRIPGVELTEKLLKLANENGFKVYVYGSEKKTLEKLNDLIKNNFLNIKIIGMKDGFSNNENDIKNDIISKRPDIIFVALGVPKQELFIKSLIDEVDNGIFIGVGGSLDVISGVKKRAPKLIRKLNLEWLYRISKEPKRIARFIKSNYIFIKKNWRNKHD